MEGEARGKTSRPQDLRSGGSIAACALSSTTPHAHETRARDEGGYNRVRAGWERESGSSSSSSRHSAT